MKITPLFFAAFALMLAACSTQEAPFDASGTFEATEVMVAAQQSGQLMALSVREGDRLAPNQAVGRIDVTGLELQKAQTEARIASLQEKLNTAAPQIEVLKKQIEVLKTQIAYLTREKARLEKLLKADAATQKQYDDIVAKLDEANTQLSVYQQQIEMNTANVNVLNRSIMSERGPLEKSIAQLDDQIARGIILNPVKGTVLTQYAYAGEMTAAGKTLYKIAALDTLNLRAYVSGNQLPGIKLGQTVKVRTDDDKGGFTEYSGVIFWISDKAEFTPKTIQTKDERQNLVYAVKIRVANKDGYLKIGMYGEVTF